MLLWQSISNPKSLHNFQKSWNAYDTTTYQLTYWLLWPYIKNSFSAPKGLITRTIRMPSKRWVQVPHFAKLCRPRDSNGIPLALVQLSRAKGHGGRRKRDKRVRDADVTLDLESKRACRQTYLAIIFLPLSLFSTPLHPFAFRRPRPSDTARR